MLIIKHLELNVNSFSIAIGVNSTVVHNIVKGRNAPGYNVLYQIAIAFDNIDMNWVIAEVGNMIKTGIDQVHEKKVILVDPVAVTGAIKDCEKCKMKDELITMKEEVIKTLLKQTDTQSKLIDYLEGKKGPGVE